MEELKRLNENDPPFEDPEINQLVTDLDFIIENVVDVLKEGGRTLDDALRLGLQGLQEIWYTAGAKRDYELEDRKEQLDDLLAAYPEEKIMAASQWLLRYHWGRVDYGGDSLAMQAEL
tara:strand:- start:237 stop:590 length:354 start_codon:yes stop_codon:yes gene_type:complete